MLAEGDIPFVFVQRSTGLRLLGVATEGDAACTTATPADATSAGVDLTAQTEVGTFIDEEGSNVWGIEVHTMQGKTYLLASDRDRGLYILKYTGDRGGRVRRR
jgi:hypothetical protein